MAKFIVFLNFLLLYLTIATCAVANMAFYSSETPPTEELTNEPSPTPEDFETVYDKNKIPNDPELQLYVKIMSVNFDDSQLICNITFYIYLHWWDIRLPIALKQLDIPVDYESDHNENLYQNIDNHTEKIWTPSLLVGSTTMWKFMEFPVNRNEERVTIDIYPKKAAEVSIITTWHLGAKCEIDDLRYFPRENYLCRLIFISDPSPEDGRIALNGSAYDNYYHSKNVKWHPVFYRREAVAKQIGQFGILIDILFTRKIGYHLIQTFVPSALLTGVSLISLFLPVEVAGDRISLCVGVLIALTVFANEARKTGPVVSYITAMDIWLLGCISIETFILIENIIILKITTRRVIPRLSPVMSEIAKAVRSTPGDSLRPTDDNNAFLGNARENQEQVERIAIINGIRLALRVDNIFLIISIGFVLTCNIAYWLNLHFHENEMVNELNLMCGEECDYIKNFV